MKFFVDTADIKDIKELNDLGLLDGVTTNPSLIAKSGRDFKEVIAEICSIVPGPVSAEVASTEYAGMIAEGERLATAIKAAEGLGGRTDRACTDAAYAPAVERLEHALAAAERAAGVSAAGPPGPDHAHG